MCCGQFDADDRARCGRCPSQPVATTATEGRQNDGQTSTKVGTDIVINEWIDTRIAVGEHVTDNTKHRVPASVRLLTHVDQ